jgi:hypothetical protein
MTRPMNARLPGFSCRCLILITVATSTLLWLFPLQSSSAEDAASSSQNKNFNMLDGKGVPVCEAYLELLNKTEFESTPFCGRPHSGPVKGFEPLDGHFISLEEIWPLFTKVWEFMRFGDQSHAERFFYPNTNPQLAHWSADAASQRTLALGLKLGWLSVWSFSEPVDINNDRTPLNVVIWQGYGATGTAKMCGTDYAFSPWELSYINQRAFVLTPDSKSIDESQTRLIFGALRGAARSVDPQLPSGSVKPGPNAFRPLADSIGIFKFEGRYYIETEGRAQDKYGGPAPVRVLLREHGNTRQVCALNPESVPIPQD